MESSIFSTLFSLISAIPSIAVLIICLYLLSKKATVQAVLLTIGSGMGLLLTLFYSVVMPYLLNGNNIAYTQTDIIYKVAGFISFISSVCFAVGLFMLIQNIIDKNKIVSNQFPPSNY